MEDNTEVIEELKKKIKAIESKVKYSKNPLEERHLRSQLGTLRRELKLQQSKH